MENKNEEDKSKVETTSNETTTELNENLNNAQISKVSLKLSERRSVNHRKSLTLTSIIQVCDGIHQINSREVDVNFEGPGTSGITAQITLLYNKNTCSETELEDAIIDGKVTKSKSIDEIAPSHSEPTQLNSLDCPLLEKHVPDLREDLVESEYELRKPPPYSPFIISSAHINSRSSVFEPSNFSLPPPIVVNCAPPLSGAPPAYSAIMRIGPIESQPARGSAFRPFGRRVEIRLQPSPPFIAPIPPPSYAETHGLCVSQGRPVPNVNHGLARFIDLDDTVWGIEPASLICPHCNNFVLTTVHTHRSNLTHFSALALCMCGCWPCCLLPYCLKACKTTYHECPICLTVIGMYNPW